MLRCLHGYVQGRTYITMGTVLSKRYSEDIFVRFSYYSSFLTLPAFLGSGFARWPAAPLCCVQP